MISGTNAPRQQTRTIVAIGPDAFTSAISRQIHETNETHDFMAIISQLLVRQALPSSATAHQRQLLLHAVTTVQRYDPASVLAGWLLLGQPKKESCATMAASYFAIRSFWIETGLRKQNSARHVSPHAPPSEHLAFWQEGIQHVLDKHSDALPQQYQNPTLELLQYLIHQQGVPWNQLESSKKYFEDILQGRQRDLNVQQYPGMEDLIQHAADSCGSLTKLVLESSCVCTSETHPHAYQAAHHIGICHGVTNALRLSITTLSSTGKLVIPHDLLQKHHVSSPRYLLSSLAMGDDKNQQPMERAVEEMVQTARRHLQTARECPVLSESYGSTAVKALLPGLASETFLDRLEQRHFLLTDRTLRQVSLLEHSQCSYRMMRAYWQQTY